MTAPRTPRSAESLQQDLRRELARRHGVDSARIRIVFAPYRVCPLGAHIDHQGGRVTALAIDHGVTLAYAPAPDREVRLSSLDFPGEVHCGLGRVDGPRPGDWGNYLRGAVTALTRGGHRLDSGLVGVTAGSWSEGGLGSSAAVGLAYLLALEEVNGLTLTPIENIRLDQAIENDYLGLRNGILDQAGSLLSRREHLTVVRCDTAEHTLIPSPSEAPTPAILIVFSGLRQPLGATGYNQRVAECTQAAQALLEHAGRTAAAPRLGLVTPEEYAAHAPRLAGAPARRAAHFFSESERVQRGLEAWRRGDWPGFGRLMTASGESSIRNYECGCPPLTDLFEILHTCPGVWGARFSGAGFRGCCIAWAEPSAAPSILEEVKRAYARRQPALANAASALVCHSGDGARLV